MSINWQRIKQVLAEAAELHSPAERAAYLDDACRGNEPLRLEVEKLLKAHDQAEGFLEQPAISVPELAAGLSAPLTEKPGDWIGPYKLLQQIGEGGCGVVYMAEQEQPIRRRVALKVIKLGMDTKSVIARFEAERQALALMDHPNIARVLDAGAIGAEGSESQISNLKSDISLGRPYFVMELVRGIKITDYCDQHHLSTEARLNLFVQVCHALQHAHQKGIIHRDIKPSNILVTLHDGAPMPKVIDFGIAKATDQRLTDKTLFTAFEQLIGTPAYMSPEQAQMSAMGIDTRSDIYALGVLLYELLTGQTPFDPKELVSAGLDGMRRIILEAEPKRPSTRLSTLAASDQTTVAKCRQCEPPQLIHRLRGDLDWIVMRCLEKDRTRRYETANNLAEDVQRHLNNEPVTARPPSKAYRFQKLVQRNKVTFAAGALVTVALVLGLGFSLWTLAKERAARRQALAAERKAQAEAGKSQQVAQFLKDMLQGVGPSVALGRDTTMLREILDKTAERVGKDLHDQPEVEAELRTTLGNVYYPLAQGEKAEEMYRAALTLQRGMWGNMNTNVADSLDRLGSVLLELRSNPGESGPLLEEALLIRTNLLGTEHPHVATSWCRVGQLRLWQGRAAEGEALIERSLAMRRRLLGNEHAAVIHSLFALGMARLELGKPEEAETVLREALAIQARVLPDNRAAPGAGQYELLLGVALGRQGKLEEAETLLRKAANMREDLLGGEHPNVAAARNALSVVLVAAGKLEEAERCARSALAICRKTIGEAHPLTAETLGNLGLILRRGGKLAEAEPLLAEVLERLKPFPASVTKFQVLALLGEMHLKEGKLPAAEAELREAVRLSRELSLEAESRQWVASGAANALKQQQKWAEAESFYRESLTHCAKIWPNDPKRWQWQVADLAAVLQAQGKLAEAETFYHDAVTKAARYWPDDFKTWQWQFDALVDVLQRLGKTNEVERWRKELLPATMTNRPGPAGTRQNNF